MKLILDLATATYLANFIREHGVTPSNIKSGDATVILNVIPLRAGSEFLSIDSARCPLQSKEERMIATKAFTAFRA